MADLLNTNPNDTYGDDAIVTLSPREHIRLRPGSLPLTQPVRQLTFDDLPQLSPGKEDRLKCLTGQM